PGPGPRARAASAPAASRPEGTVLPAPPTGPGTPGSAGRVAPGAAGRVLRRRPAAQDGDEDRPAHAHGQHRAGLSLRQSTVLARVDLHDPADVHPHAPGHELAGLDQCASGLELYLLDPHPHHARPGRDGLAAVLLAAAEIPGAGDGHRLVRPG